MFTALGVVVGAMQLKSLLTNNPSRTSKLYLGIGVLSLVKAIAVRNDSERFRRELFDAGFYLAIGLVLSRYAAFVERKRTDLESQVPEWLVDLTGGEGGSAGRPGPLARLAPEEASESASTSGRVRRLLAE